MAEELPAGTPWIGAWLAAVITYGVALMDWIPVPAYDPIAGSWHVSWASEGAAISMLWYGQSAVALFVFVAVALALRVLQRGPAQTLRTQQR